MSTASGNGIYVEGIVYHTQGVLAVSLPASRSGLIRVPSLLGFTACACSLRSWYIDTINVVSKSDNVLAYNVGNSDHHGSPVGTLTRTRTRTRHWTRPVARVRVTRHFIRGCTGTRHPPDPYCQFTGGRHAAKARDEVLQSSNTLHQSRRDECQGVFVRVSSRAFAFLAVFFSPLDPSSVFLPSFSPLPTRPSDGACLPRLPLAAFPAPPFALPFAPSPPPFPAPPRSQLPALFETTLTCCQDHPPPSLTTETLTTSPPSTTRIFLCSG
ncbi:hypothetical protein C8R45DRAFT_1103306 [Mycena sanguinolenta]|nr:hypothetical protein C8R45DRAFT_1103306 [Mycena sanguinolenta]